MDNVHQRTRKCKRKIVVMKKEDYEGREMSSRVELIQQLIPLGLMKVEEELSQEVERLAGQRYSRAGYDRHGSNPGSVVLAGQRLGISVPRLRDLERGMEIPLS